MATRNPAVALGIDDRLGTLKAGAFGDIAVYDGRGRTNPYRAIIEAGPESTILVLRRSSLPFSVLTGQPYVGSIGLYGDAAVIAALPPRRMPITTDGATPAIAVPSIRTTTAGGDGVPATRGPSPDADRDVNLPCVTPPS